MGCANCLLSIGARRDTIPGIFARDVSFAAMENIDLYRFSNLEIYTKACVVRPQLLVSKEQSRATPRQLQLMKNPHGTQLQGRLCGKGKGEPPGNENTNTSTIGDNIDNQSPIACMMGHKNSMTCNMLY
jgi:hypothetical protein